MVLSASCGQTIKPLARQMARLMQAGLQVNGLGEAKAEMAIDTEHNVFAFLTGTKNRVGGWVSFLAGTGFGEDTGGFDHDRPAADV